MKYKELYEKFCIEEVAMFFPYALNHLVKQKGALKHTNYEPELVVDIFVKSNKILIPNNLTKSKTIKVHYLKNGTFKNFNIVEKPSNILLNVKTSQDCLNLSSIELIDDKSRLNFIESICREILLCTPASLSKSRISEFWHNPDNFIADALEDDFDSFQINPFALADELGFIKSTDEDLDEYIDTKNTENTYSLYANHIDISFSEPYTELFRKWSA